MRLCLLLTFSSLRASLSCPGSLFHTNQCSGYSLLISSIVSILFHTFFPLKTTNFHVLHHKTSNLQKGTKTPIGEIQFDSSNIGGGNNLWEDWTFPLSRQRFLMRRQRWQRKQNFDDNSRHFAF